MEGDCRKARATLRYHSVQKKWWENGWLVEGYRKGQRFQQMQWERGNTLSIFLRNGQADDERTARHYVPCFWDIWRAGYPESRGAETTQQPSRYEHYPQCLTNKNAIGWTMRWWTSSISQMRSTNAMMMRCWCNSCLPNRGFEALMSQLLQKWKFGNKRFGFAHLKCLWGFLFFIIFSFFYFYRKLPQQLFLVLHIRQVHFVNKILLKHLV